MTVIPMTPRAPAFFVYFDEGSWPLSDGERAGLERDARDLVEARGRVLDATERRRLLLTRLMLRVQDAATVGCEVAHDDAVLCDWFSNIYDAAVRVRAETCAALGDETAARWVEGRNDD